MTKKSSLLANIIFLISSLAAAGLIVVININKLLPDMYRIIYVFGVLLVYFLIALIIVKKPEKKKLNYFIIFILFLMAIVQGFLAYYIQKTYLGYNSRVNESNIEQVSYSVITSIDNDVNSIEDINNATIYYDETDPVEEIFEIEEKIKDVNDRINFEAGESSLELGNSLLEKDIEYMILNSSKLSLMTSANPDFEEKYKVLKLGNDGETSLNIDKEIEDISKQVEAGESFNVLISGTDTSGSLNENTRSDVNLLLTINPKDKKILLTSIPRDSYVLMSGLGYDKLTHAGTFGMKTLVETVEDLLQTDINYYVKVNFESLIDLVDILGGVEVYNEREFVSVIGGYYFEQGNVTLDGEKALAFVRERYSFEDGDFARGRNQMKVLEAMIKKAMSPAILLNYNEFLNTSLDSMNTNLPTNKITEMINLQIQDMSAWDIEQNQITGDPVMGLPSYAMPGFELSMTQLSEYSINEAKQKIDQVLEQEE